MRILAEYLLQWDPVRQTSNGKGTIGTVVVFAPADEEQGRKILHSHWQIRRAQLSQSLRNDLFSQSPIFRKRAREKFFKLFYNFMHSNYGPDFDVTHRCIQDRTGNTSAQTPAQQRSNCHFEYYYLQVFRNARHK